MSELQPLICPQCGAAINRKTYVCEYCGTKFKKDEEMINPFAIEILQPGTRVIQSQCVMTEEVVRMMGSKEASEFVIKQMAKEMANQIAPFMDVEISRSDRNPFDTKVRARLRVLEPTYRF